MKIKPLRLVQRFKRYSYIMLPLLLVSGAISTHVGRLTDRLGGRQVMVRHVH